MALLSLATAASAPAFANDAATQGVSPDGTRSEVQQADVGKKVDELSLFVRWSDSRLKSHVERVGSAPLGIGVYEYEIFGKRERGVLAQEVEQVLPEAVITTESGYKMVRYDLIPGWNAAAGAPTASEFESALYIRWSDERLKSNIVQVGSLGDQTVSMRETSEGAPTRSDFETSLYVRWSDERLKSNIVRIGSL